MANAFLLDENIRGPLWQFIRRHNARGIDALDVLRVGDPADLPLASEDPDIIRWAARENRILISLDEHTLAGHLTEFLAGGNHSPGILIPRAVPLIELVEFLACVAHASEPAEWQDQITYIP